MKNTNPLMTLVGVIVSPHKTLKELVDNPRLKFIAFVEIFGFVIFALLRFPVYKNAYITKYYMEGVDPSQLTATAIKVLIESPFLDALPWVIYTVIFYVILKLFKVKASVKQVAVITGYAYTTILVYYIVSIIASFFTGQLMIDASVAAILSVFIPNLNQMSIYGVLQTTSVFVLWQFWVIAVGLYELSGIKKRIIYPVTYIPFLIIPLIEFIFG